MILIYLSLFGYSEVLYQDKEYKRRYRFSVDIKELSFGHLKLKCWYQVTFG